MKQVGIIKQNILESMLNLNLNIFNLILFFGTFSIQDYSTVAQVSASAAAESLLR